MNKTYKNLLMLLLLGYSSVILAQATPGVVCEDKIIAGQIVKRCYEGSLPKPSAGPPTTNPVDTPIVKPNFPVAPGSNSPRLPRPKPANSCTSSAHRILPYVPDATNQMWVDIHPWEKFTILVDTDKLPLINRSYYYMGVAEGGAESRGADIQFVISECPGDFNSSVENSPFCGNHTTQYGDSIRFKAGEKQETRPPICWLKPGTTKIYFNVRLIKLPTPNPPAGAGTSSCPEGYTCKFVFALSR